MLYTGANFHFRGPRLF